MIRRASSILAAALLFAGPFVTAAVTPGSAARADIFVSASGVMQSETYNPNIVLGANQYSSQNSVATVAINAEPLNLHLFSAYSYGDGPSQQVRLTAEAGWQDSLTLNVPNRAGQAGTYIASLGIQFDETNSGAISRNDAFLVAVAANIAAAREATVGGNTGLAYASAGNIRNVSDISEPISFSIPVIFGTPFDLGVWIYSNLDPGVRSTATSATHDAAHTVFWNGTLSVKDSGGNDLAPGSFQLNSGSGANYLQPVPEPSSLVLFAAAGAFLAGSRVVRLGARPG